MVLEKDEELYINKQISHEKDELSVDVMERLSYIADLIIYSKDKKKIEKELGKFPHYKNKIYELVEERRKK